MPRNKKRPSNPRLHWVGNSARGDGRYLIWRAPLRDSTRLLFQGAAD